MERELRSLTKEGLDRAKPEANGSKDCPERREQDQISNKHDCWKGRSMTSGNEQKNKRTNK